MADWDGRSYREVNELQRHLAIRALDGVDLGHDDHVLDVGCGDGAITAMIAQRTPDGNVLGIDSSPKMITAARALPGMRNLRFERGDVRFMPYRDEFDLVVSFNVLHWVPELTVALTRIHTALHPMGMALLEFVCAGERPSLEAVAMQVCGLPRWREFFAVFRQPFRHVEPAAYPALAAESGLRVLDSQVDDITWDFGSRAAFARWCSVGFVSWTSRLPAAVADAFLADVLDRYERVAGGPGIFSFLQMRVRLARTGAMPPRCVQNGTTRGLSV